MSVYSRQADSNAKYIIITLVIMCLIILTGCSDREGKDKSVPMNNSIGQTSAGIVLSEESGDTSTPEITMESTISSEDSIRVNEKFYENSNGVTVTNYQENSLYDIQIVQNTNKQTDEPSDARQSNVERNVYINSRYGFSIEYPKEWIASDESPAGDGVYLYSKDGNDIRVYGGYNIDNFLEEYTKKAQASGFEVHDLITSNGEKGILIEGSDQGKRLFHFIILNKDRLGQFYALVTEEFYTKYRDILIDTADKLFLGEDVEVIDINEADPVAGYQEYLNLLNPKNIRSIELAKEMYKQYVTDNKATNDTLFRDFREFYNDVVSYNIEYYSKGGIPIAEETLLRYGLKTYYSENEKLIADNPEYLPTNFIFAISDGLKEFLILRQKALEQVGQIYLKEDAALGITWNQLGDRIIECEYYINKYQDYPEAKEIEEAISLYLKLYLLDFDLDKTPMFINGVLDEEVRKSYERFIKDYSGTKHYDIVRGYYDLLKKNNFSISEEAKKFLFDNGIKLE